MTTKLRKILSRIVKVLLILKTVIEIIIELTDDDEDAPKSPVPLIWRRLHEAVASTRRAGDFAGASLAAT